MDPNLQAAFAWDRQECEARNILDEIHKRAVGEMNSLTEADIEGASKFCGPHMEAIQQAIKDNDDAELGRIMREMIYKFLTWRDRDLVMFQEQAD